MNADNICDVVGTVDWPKNLNFELSKSLCVCGQGVSRPNLFFRSLRHDRKKKQKKTREFYQQKGGTHELLDTFVGDDARQVSAVQFEFENDVTSMKLHDR